MQIDNLLKLSVAERISLIEKIWESIDPDSISITGAQKKELDKRLNLIDNGQEKFYSVAEVKTKLRKLRK
jgi:putative addiction module component (TIGR02574 family)